MTNVTVVVHAIGAAGSGLAGDIDALFQRFVNELKFFGHAVEHAAVIAGERQTVAPAATPAAAAPAASAAADAAPAAPAA